MSRYTLNINIRISSEYLRYISILFRLMVPTVQSICEANLHWLANVSIRCLPHRKDATASRSIFVISLMTNLNGESQTLSVSSSVSSSVSAAAWVANLVTDICNILHVAFEQSRPQATHVELDEVAAAATAALSSLLVCPDSHSHSHWHWHWQWHSLPLCRSAAAARFVGLTVRVCCRRRHRHRRRRRLPLYLPHFPSARLSLWAPARKCSLFLSFGSIACFALANGKRERYTI